VEVQGRLNSKQLTDLSDELVALMKQQSDARLTEVYVRMTPQEIKAFDLRTERISQIYVLLSEHDAKR
jgi:flagellar motility protein MotE (MotC chaperone)